MSKAWAVTGTRGSAARADWLERLDKLSGARRAEFERVIAGTPPRKLVAALTAYRKAHERLVDNPPWLYIVHDLNPRAMSSKVKGFVSPQSWFVDLTLVSVQ